MGSWVCVACKERVATCQRHGCLHTLALALCDLSRHLTYVLSSIQFLNMRHVTHTLHIARCTLRSPPSCERAEWRVHAVRCRSCPRCALHVYMSTELVCFPVLTCCSLTRAASNVCYRIAAISHGLPFCILFRFV